ncbi:MAG: hypothetical protein ACOCP4_07250, partial [Candidatus Woesearchaeota archaeon]
SHWPAESYVLEADITLRNFAPIYGAIGSQWPAYVNWYTSNGESGEEPPAEIKELINWSETFLSTQNKSEKDDAIKNILEAQSDNIYRIGILQMPPAPAIVNNELQNVSKTGIVCYANEELRSFHPEQFYLKD